MRKFIVIEVRNGDIFLVDKETGKAIGREDCPSKVFQILAKEVGFEIEVSEFPTDQLFKLLS